MKMASVSEFFKKYLPSLPDRNFTKEFTTEEVEKLLSYAGIKLSSSTMLSHDSNDFIVTFKKVDLNKWTVSVKFK